MHNKNVYGHQNKLNNYKLQQYFIIIFNVFKKRY